jgi:hypothetical protein
MDGAVYIVSKLNLLAMDEEEASVNTSIAGMDGPGRDLSCHGYL